MGDTLGNENPRETARNGPIGPLAKPETTQKREKKGGTRPPSVDPYCQE